MKRDKEYLKKKFSTDATPVDADYADWIDSYVHLDDQAAVDAQLVNQLLITYDQALKGGNVNGRIDSLGDVFAYLTGCSDTEKLADRLAKIAWANLPNKPGFVPLELDEQFLITDVAHFDPQPRQTPLPGSQSSNPARSSLMQIGGVNTTKNLITNINIERRWVSIPVAGGGTVDFYVDTIMGIAVCLNPRAKLS